VRTPTDPYELSVVAESPSTVYGQVLYAVLKADLADEEEMLRSLPQKCDEDFRRDFRFRMGMIEKLRQILALPNDAREILNNSSGKPVFKGG
jgi:hypothetical protein